MIRGARPAGGVQLEQRPGIGAASLQIGSLGDFVAGPFRRLVEAARGQPCQRIEPVRQHQQADEDRLEKITPLEMGQFVPQDA